MYAKMFSWALHRSIFASRILFKDKERKWEEIESKLQSEHDSLVLKSSNKVMILHYTLAKSFPKGPDGNICKICRARLKVFFPIWSKLKCLFCSTIDVLLIIMLVSIKASVGLLLCITKCNRQNHP